jgi:hypothetical protein
MRVRFKSEFLRGLVIVLLLGCASCQIPGPEARQVISQIANYEVMAKDLPAGWKFSGQDWSEHYGGQSHVVAYDVDNIDVNRGFKNSLGHTISIYPDEEQAKTAYPKWEEEWFKGLLLKQPEVNFVPSDPNDQYRFECDQIFSDKSLFGCLYLQQHKRFISFVLVNLDGKAMTFAQLNTILKAVDDRLNQIELK